MTRAGPLHVATALPSSYPAAVTPTEAGERFLQSLEPALDQIDAGLTSLGELREKPAGTIRLSATENAIASVLWPVLRKLLSEYADIRVELVADYL